MAVGIESTSDSSFELALDPAYQQNPTKLGISLPNVFVTPPEEEYDSPPWCCFDAIKDAQPGAFVYDDLVNEDFDYAAHAEGDIYDGDSNMMMGRGEGREDVFVMRSLVQEAEHLREQLKALELSSVRTRSSTASTSSGDDILGDENEVTPTASTPSRVQPQPEQKIKRTRSLFSFKSLSRKKPSMEDPSSAIPSSTSEYDLGFPLSNSGRDMEVASIVSGCSSSRKSSFFSRFRRSSKKSSEVPMEESLGVKASSAAHRSCEELSTTQEDQSPVLKRRFSIFELPRRTSSISSQSVTPSVPSATSIIPSMNQSNSSLSTSSDPPTPDAVTCSMSSPPDSPTEKVGNGISATDSFMSMSAIGAFSVDNIAASLTLPASTSRTIVSDGSFALDPLHFESLQFSSDDFP